jgi:hypothetical protein
VEVVMRNFWLYQMKDAAQNPRATAGRPASITTVAANEWPRFPQTQATKR